MLDGQLVKWQLQFVNQIADTFAQSCENTRPQKQQRDNKDGKILIAKPESARMLSFGNKGIRKSQLMKTAHALSAI